MTTHNIDFHGEIKKKKNQHNLVENVPYQELWIPYQGPVVQN